MSYEQVFDAEKKTTDNKVKNIISFWQQGCFNSFSGVDNVVIHYAQFIQQQADCPTIIISPGRCESYLKYQELCFDLYQQGYNLFIIDHRGQGLSGRFFPSVNRGYVTHFQDYVDDLQYLVENIVTKHCSAKPYILAHSMGGAIAVRFMQDFPDAIKAAVISSPMLGFNSGVLPYWLAQSLVVIKAKLNSLLSKNPWYFLGQKDYSVIDFKDNKLTHSLARYQQFVDLYSNNKAIQLGGVTSHWLMQSITAQKEIFAKLFQLKTPVLLLQAGADSVVSPQAQNLFCQQLHHLQPQSCPHGRPSRFDGAYHELFFESDNYRDKAIAQSLAWFQQHK